MTPLVLLAVVTFTTATPAGTQAQAGQAVPHGSKAPANPSRQADPNAALPADYLIGPEDVLGVLFWREPDNSGDVTVRPDGMITLPLLGDLRAAGLHPAQLREEIAKAAAKYLTDVNVTVIVRQINSRKVFITGQVTTPGAHPLVAPRTVMQLVALAGGLTEYADAEKITIIRQAAGGQPVVLKFNYKEVSKGRKMEQNVELRPGDTVVVP